MKTVAENTTSITLWRPTRKLEEKERTEKIGTRRGIRTNQVTINALALRERHRAIRQLGSPEGRALGSVEAWSCS